MGIERISAYRFALECAHIRYYNTGTRCRGTPHPLSSKPLLPLAVHPLAQNPTRLLFWLVVGCLYHAAHQGKNPLGLVDIEGSAISGGGATFVVDLCLRLPSLRAVG